MARSIVANTFNKAASGAAAPMSSRERGPLVNGDLKPRSVPMAAPQPRNEPNGASMPLRHMAGRHHAGNRRQATRCSAAQAVM